MMGQRVVDEGNVHKLIRLTDRLDGYHRRRQEKHGYLYLRVRSFGDGDFVEARSIATGVVCTFDRRFIEEVGSAVQEPEGS